MTTILLCGYRPLSENNQPLGCETNTSGQTVLDRRIEELQNLGMQVICVVAGETAEEQLRKCHKLSQVELVFDTNGAESCLASNLIAGVKASQEKPCFVLPVDVPVPPTAIWRALTDEARRSLSFSDAAFIQAIDAQGAPCHFGFPLFIPRRGHQILLKLKDFKKLQDPRVKIQHVVCEAETDLASGIKPI